ncbi:hypothetical protein BGX28_005463 [Mortierella sp. GBA30]|nr:hypothetical protein BGX28_005463 [Mortierella sp. GBA30]
MKEYQGFRVPGQTKVENIEVDNVDGQNNCEITINKIRDSNRIRIEPHCIKHCPSVVLDVVLSTAIEQVHVDSSKVTPGRILADASTTKGNVVGALPGCEMKSVSEIPQAKSLSQHVGGFNIMNDISTVFGPSEPLHLGPLRKSTMQIQGDMKTVTDVVTDALIANNGEGNAPSSGKTIVSFQPAKSVTLANSEFEVGVIHKLDELYEHGHTTQRIAQEVWALSKQMNDRLILIERKTRATLTQNYELLDAANTPRQREADFVITSTSPRMKDMSSTNRQSSSKKYGPFLLLMLEMIKMGTNIAGYVVPALVSLKAVDIFDPTQCAIGTVTSQVVRGIDYSPEYVE